MSKISIFIDFDGTISTQDLAVRILKKFAKGWEKYDQLLMNGEITLQECMVSQYGLIKTSKEEMVKIVDINDIRSGFVPFVNYLRLHGIKIQILSAGLDFIIHHLLQKLDLEIDYIASKTNITSNGIELEFPEFNAEKYRDFKAAKVANEKQNGYRVIYIGDGLSDFEGAKYADFVYCVANSSLSDYCFENSKKYEEFRDFFELKRKINSHVDEKIDHNQD